MNCVIIKIVILLNLIFVSFACSGGRLLRNGLVATIDKYEILKAHNDYRDEVAQGKIPRQPGAEKMLEMRWDDELAQIAQKWADHCVYTHNQNRSLNRFKVGENLAIEFNTEPTFSHQNGNNFPLRVRLWFEEYKLYTFGAEFSTITGHYTQIIWADTYLVGCGFAYYKELDGFYVRYYVCNYGPSGNFLGVNPYVVGTPSCSSYGLSPSKQYLGLCQNTKTDTNSIISNDIDLPVVDRFITNFTPTTTEGYTILNKQFVNPSIPETTFKLNTEPYFTYQTTLENNLLKDIISTSTQITTQQLPATTITTPFTTTSESLNKTTTLNLSPISDNQPIQTTTELNHQNQPGTTFNPFQFSPLPGWTRIEPNDSPHQYEAVLYNHHRQFLNEIFRRQQQRTIQVRTYLINSGPKSPYFTYKWSDLFK